jgi:hypothetical protein
MENKRRDFLIKSLGFVGTSFLSQFLPPLEWIAQAAIQNPGDPHFFVLIHPTGAMDVTCGLDPQVLSNGLTETDMFLEYKKEEIFVATSTSKQPLTLAPAAQKLSQHTFDIAVVNGIVMTADESDPGHQSAQEYITSGKGDTSANALPMEIAARTQRGPYGVLTSNLSINRKNAVELTNILDLTRISILGQAQEVDSVQALAGLAQSYGDTSKVPKHIQGYLNTNEVKNGFNQKLEEVRAIVGDNLNEYHVLTAALAGGASRQAYFQYAPGNLTFDTHSSHQRNHMQAQTAFWNTVADFISLLKQIRYGNTQNPVFKYTTIMVTNEFSRTPALNGAVGGTAGKDHNPKTNSILLAGRGVVGGQTIGRSTIIPRSLTGSLPIHIGNPYDYKTGTSIPFASPSQAAAEITDTSRFIRPENVAATVRDIFKANARQFSPALAASQSILDLVKGGRS